MTRTSERREGGGPGLAHRESRFVLPTVARIGFCALDPGPGAGLHHRDQQAEQRLFTWLDRCRHARKHHVDRAGGE